jgi:hypothetical protein
MEGVADGVAQYFNIPSIFYPSPLSLSSFLYLLILLVQTLGQDTLAKVYIGRMTTDNARVTTTLNVISSPLPISSSHLLSPHDFYRLKMGP